MSKVKDRLDGIVDWDELGSRLDLGKLREKFDLKDLGSRFDLDRLTDLLNERKSKKSTNTLLFVLAIIGTIALAAGIAFLIWRYLTPAYTDDYDDEFDDFEDEDEDS